MFGYKSSIIVIYYCVVFYSVRGANILLLSTQAYSHMHEGLSIGEELVNRGHSVYLALSSKVETPKITQTAGIGVLRYRSSHMQDPFTTRWLKEGHVNVSLHFDDNQKMTFFTQVHSVLWRECSDMMDDEAFVEQVRHYRFDLAIVDRFVLLECLPIVPISLGIPFVSIGSHHNYWLLRVPSLPISLPFPHLVPDVTYSGFLQRLRNTLVLVYSLNAVNRDNTSLIEKYGRTETDKKLTWTDIQRSAGLFLINLESTLAFPQTSMPNTIFVGGLTCKPAKPLPDDLDNLMTSSKHGLILFSFGSFADYLPDYVINKFVNAFKMLKETVIWKFNGHVNFPIPENVILRRWIPQNDLLGHNKTRLFITHSGNNGQYESMYHGVPMLAFYLFGDQEYNARRVKVKGYGDMMSLNNFTSEELVAKINKIIDDPVYSENVRRASMVYRDQPMSARQKAAHWVEHVLKFGSKHLRPTELDMPWYQFISLDVILAIIALLFGLLIAMLLVTKVIVRFLLSLINHKAKSKLE